MSKVVNLHEVPSIVGSYNENYSVVVEGRAIPRMRCLEHESHIEIILDGRFSYSFPKDIAYLAASFAAQALAIGMGYSHIGADNKDQPFAPQVMRINK